MSEKRESNETVKCHEFGPPKSLQGMENADGLWKMITKRFPNAAPLLCEMEAVIDRADDLLRQLRTPCVRSVETSSFNNCVESEESNEMSLICDEFFPEDTDVFEDVAATMNIAETQISESSVSMSDTDFDSLEKSTDSRDDIHCEEHQKENDNSQVIESRCKHSSSKMNEASMVESWSKFVDNEPKKVNTPRPTNEQNLQEQMVDSPTKSKKIVVTKVFERTQRNEKRNSSGDWVDNMKETNFSAGDALQEKETCQNINIIDNNESQISGDDRVPQGIDCKTPWNILKEYAKRCDVKIEYHCEKNKCNHYVITGKLLHFSATASDDNEEVAKNNVAIKILQNVADHQMNDNKMEQLLKLSRKQILEILNFGNDETIETPLRKAYMMCVKKGAPPPKYITETKYSPGGVKCVAKCMALGHVAEGYGVRRSNAKKAAAEQILSKI